MQSFSLTREEKADFWEVEYLLDTSFGPERLGLSSYQLRENIPPVQELCLVARDGRGVLAGAIRFWPVLVGAQARSGLLLGPVAVHPTRQGEGLGALLIGEALVRARDLAYPFVLLVGDAEYYGRFGFEICPKVNFPPPTNPKRVLIRALLPDGVQGVSGEVRRFKEGYS